MRCTFCEEEMEPGVADVPVCAKCSREPAARIAKPSTEQQIRASLHREILATAARAHAASKALIAIMADVPGGLPHPDGSLRIQNAARALAAARSEVMKAHSRLDEFLVRGIIPVDLEPGGPA